jgi:hypothetical protein
MARTLVVCVLDIERMPSWGEDTSGLEQGVTKDEPSSRFTELRGLLRRQDRPWEFSHVYRGCCISQHYKGMAMVGIIARISPPVLKMLRSCRMSGHGDMNIKPELAKMGRGARDAFAVHPAGSCGWLTCS